MPEHIEQDYITKYNSHLGFVTHQEICPNKTYDWDDSYMYRLPRYWTRRMVPIGLIVKYDCDDENNKESNGSANTIWKFHSDMQNHFTDRNCRAKYIVAMLEDVYEEDYSVGRSACKIGLIRLGKLGFRVDQAKVVDLKHEFSGSTPLFVDNSNFLSFVRSVSDLGVEISILSHNFIWNITFHLDNKIVEESFVQIHNSVPIVNMHAMRDGRYPHPHNLPILEIGHLKRLPTFKRIYDNSQLHMCCYLVNLDGNSMEMRLDSLIEKRDYRSTSVIIPCVCEKSNECYMVAFRKNFVDVTRISFTENDEEEIEKLEEPLEFIVKNKLDFQFEDRNSFSVCQLTGSKFLIMVYERIFNPKTFQDVFLNLTKWFLIDVENKIIKRVYPRVYEMENPNRDSNAFRMVTRKKRTSRKVFNKSIPPEDGDLNGGYSDHVILSSLQSKALECDSQSNSLEFIDSTAAIEYSSISSFRPFVHSPDLFQVNLTVPHYLYSGDRTRKQNLEEWAKNPLNHGKMFRFYFRFRDEAIGLFGNMQRIRQLCDISFCF